jgi:hypothetical protein
VRASGGGRRAGQRHRTPLVGREEEIAILGRAGASDALKFMAAAFLNDKQTGDLLLHPRRHYDRAWFRLRLHPRRNVRCVTVNLARRIDHDRKNASAGKPALNARIGIETGPRFTSASARWIESAARDARSASFSCATG